MSNLILTRRIGETLMIGNDVTVTIVAINGNQVRCAIKAPRDIIIDREEIRERRIEDQRRAERALIKGLHVIEFRDNSGKTLCHIAARTEAQALALFHSEFIGLTLADFTTHTAWDYIMASYVGTRHERPIDAAIYDLLLQSAQRGEQAPFLMSMPDPINAPAVTAPVVAEQGAAA